uniref:Uncharacterized protein n=1 Tax=Cyanistes caeruleus TaxID=156563 RepID=A0A8C0UBT0_CYACU
MRNVAISMGSRRMLVLLEAVPSGYMSVSEVGCREPSSSPWNRPPRASWGERRKKRGGPGEDIMPGAALCPGQPDTCHDLSHLGPSAPGLPQHPLHLPRRGRTSPQHPHA